MRKFLIFAKLSFIFVGISFLAKAQSTVLPQDSLLPQVPLQIWTEADGRDSIQSPEFVKKNSLIVSKPCNSQKALSEEEILLIAPERREQFNPKPKKD